MGVAGRCNNQLEAVVGNWLGSLAVGSLAVGNLAVAVGSRLVWLEGNSLECKRNFEVYLGCCYATRHRRWFEAS